MKKIYDITIIGSGLTGLTIGLALSSLGYKIALVDPKPLFFKKDKYPDNRTTAISSGSVDFYKRIELEKFKISYIEENNKFFILINDKKVYLLNDLYVNNIKPTY